MEANVIAARTMFSDSVFPSVGGAATDWLRVGERSWLWLNVNKVKMSCTLDFFNIQPRP